MRSRIIIFFIIAAVMCAPLFDNFRVTAADEGALSDEYRRSFNAVLLEADIEENGFRPLEHHIYIVEHAVLGELTLIPAINENYNRLALFFARGDRSIVFKTDDFASNSWLSEQVRQTNRDVGGIAYRDLDGDGLRDIVIISICKNESGLYADKTYTVGDVLFQNQPGFYRDYRISDKINRYDMNKSLDAVTEFVRDGISMEFLFTAKTMDELLAGGFTPIKYLCITENLEKFGVVDIVPGFYNTVGQNYLMIYIIDPSGRILWNFQPMHYYVNFYSIIEMSLKDIDGDGNKDVTILGLYVTYGEDGKAFIRQDYDIYYQRAGYFLEDVDFKRGYTCGVGDDIGTITDMARNHWRWPR